jgi:hypothetical protein
MATLTDTVPNITYPDAPVITAVTGDTFDVKLDSYDSSAVEYTGVVTFVQEKIGSQTNYIFDQYSIEIDKNNIFDSSAVDYTGQLTFIQEKIGSQTNYIFDQYSIEMDNNIFDSSAVDYTGQLTFIQEKIGSQTNYIFDQYSIEIDNTTLTQDIEYTGQLQMTITKVNSAIPLSGFSYTSSSFGEGTGGSTTTETSPTQDDSYEILIQ